MRISPVRWLIAGVALALFLLVFYLSGWVGPTERLDIGVLTALRTNGTPALLWIVSVPWLILCSIIIIAIGIRRGRAMDGVRAFALLAVCNVLGQVLKKVVLHRDSIVLTVNNTYPSGHMIAFASVAMALRIVLPQRMRRTFTVIASLVLCVVAFELVHYGWHRPSDVIGSLLLVTAIGVLNGMPRDQDDSESANEEHGGPEGDDASRALIRAQRRGIPADDPTAGGR